jgi:putative addiction module component (TIGR02574 family)
MTAKEMINEIEALPVEDRIAVAETVLRSLNVPESEHDTEWAAVANRRLHDLREGRVEPVSLEDVKKSIARRFSS